MLEASQPDYNSVTLGKATCERVKCSLLETSTVYRLRRAALRANKPSYHAARYTARHVPQVPSARPMPHLSELGGDHLRDVHAQMREQHGATVQDSVSREPWEGDERGVRLAGRARRGKKPGQDGNRREDAAGCLVPKPVRARWFERATSAILHSYVTERCEGGRHKEGVGRRER